MKTLTKTLLLGLLLSAGFLKNAHAQTPYYDALALKKLLDAGGKWQEPVKPQVMDILANYCPKSNIKSIFFTRDKFISAYSNFTDNDGGSGGLNALSSGIGGFNVTNMANGIALFLIDRAKGEIDEAFFVRLNDFLAKYPEFATLFPNTRVFLSNFKSWEYANLLNTLKEAFNKDIKALPADIIKLKGTVCTSVSDSGDRTACSTRLAAIQDFLKSKDGRLLLAACKLGDGFIQGNKIPDIIDPVVKPAYLLNDTVGFSENTRSGLQMLNILNKSMESNETGKSYLTSEQFDQLKSDKTLQDLFLGLIWGQMAVANNYKGLVFTIDDTHKVNVTTDIFTKDNLDGINSYLANLYNQTKNLQTAYDNLKKDRLDGKKELSPDLIALTQSVQQLIQALRTTAIIDSRLVIPDEANYFFDQTNSILEISGQILNVNYSAAIMGTLTLINTAAQRYDPAADHKELAVFRQDFLKYASFAANFVEAKTPEEAKAAIESVALPAGSYTIKQKSDFNISLNGYLGYTFDLDYASGIYAPVGFSFSHGWAGKSGWALTGFAGLIDVGSLVSYNLYSGNTGTQKQEIRLESIFSPSAQVFFEIGRTPICFGGGYRRTPKLFYTKSDGTFNPVPAKGVFTVSILIDIPIFTLHNNPYK
ncbi:hypothetical protein FHW88_004992 [Mucilaginibacter sp. SG538B]|uniref:hypothetical protein n=1 Tax=Mucilaginibacter sp. SG538B TaxID=2587021 RepID=UPI00159D95EF|nr:hypothetical protein [Mucilaginibacter sp. SG538B]NVM66674.1 hypothetical protein [Mucilaginibacter sp. SG538B]